MHTLDPDKSHFRMYGKGHVFASEIALGESCEQLYRAGDDEALVAADVHSSGLSPDQIHEEIRKPLQVFRAADTAVQSMADWRPPGAHELIGQGFIPLEDLTGDEEIVHVWPADHRYDVAETRTRAPSLDPTDDGRYWLVRSPWPAVSTEDVIDLVWEWEADHCPQRSGRITDENRARRAAARREFFQLDTAAVRELQRARAERRGETDSPG
jgi:hypothetical protein